MGVYIPNMKMPRTGQVYTFEVVKRDEAPCMRIRAGFEVVTGVCGIDLEEKWEEYPLVEIKEPHGRLIDVNALEYCDEEEKANNDVFEAVRGSGSGSTIHIYGSGFRDGILTMTSKIRFAPTIIEAEGKDDG